MSHSLSAAVPLVPANAENRYEVTRADLPLSCPMPGMALWNSHPKVYLPIVDDGGESTCARRRPIRGSEVYTQIDDEDWPPRDRHTRH